MVTFTEHPLGLIITETPFDSVRLTETNQRQLIAYLWRNKPELVREIVCKNCPEHAEVVQNDNYHLNKVKMEERERVLKLIENDIESKQMISSGCDGHKMWIWSELVLELIQSLRKGVS